MRKGQKIKLLTNVGKLKKNEIVTVTGVDYALRIAFIKNDKGISESVDNNFSNYQLMNDSNDNLLSEKQLLELAKKHNWNEDKMLNELRKLNLGVSNSDLQAIVEGFLLLNAKDANEHVVETYHRNGSKYRIIKAPNGKFFNVYGDYKEATQAGPYDTLEEARKMMEKHRPKAVKDANERLKTYKIKNHDSGKTYRVRAKSYQDAKDKYEKFIAKNPVNDAVQWDTLLANLGFMHHGGHGKIQKWKYRGDNYNDFEKAINHIRRIDRNLILSASHINSNEYIITIEKPITDSFDGESKNFVGDVYIPDIEKHLKSKFSKNEKNLDKIFKELKSKFPNADKDEIDYVVSGYLNDWNDNQYDRLLSKYFKDATIAQLEIKNQFLNENDDADDIIYLGFNDDRKISFYEYNNEYYAFFDLENRVEKIDKEKVQRILKKNIIETSEENNKDEPFREPGDEGLAATVRAEDDGAVKILKDVKSKLKRGGYR